MDYWNFIIGMCNNHFKCIKPHSLLTCNNIIIVGWNKLIPYYIMLYLFLIWLEWWLCNNPSSICGQCARMRVDQTKLYPQYLWLTHQHSLKAHWRWLHSISQKIYFSIIIYNFELYSYFLNRLFSPCVIT